MRAECRAQMCAGACRSCMHQRGKLARNRMILSGAALVRALAAEDGSCGGESWRPNDAPWCGTQKCLVWREDAGCGVACMLSIMQRLLRAAEARVINAA